MESQRKHTTIWNINDKPLGKITSANHQQRQGPVQEHRKMQRRKTKGHNRGPMPVREFTRNCWLLLASGHSRHTGLFLCCSGNVLRKTEMSYVDKVTYMPLPHKKVRPGSHSSREDGRVWLDEKILQQISGKSSFPFLKISSKHRQHVQLGSFTIFAAQILFTVQASL